MTDTHARMPHFEPLHPWANRILWVDLSARTARAEPSAAYLPDYLGSRGLAARLCWEHYPEPEAFLSELCIKAGWETDRWRIQPYPSVEVYSVYVFGE